MLCDLIKHLIISLGKYEEKKHDTYKPRYSGQWKNKGTDYKEDWQWVEKKSSRRYVINIFQLEDDYIITVGSTKKGNAIDNIECRDQREVEITLGVLRSYYGELGNVVINNPEK